MTQSQLSSFLLFSLIWSLHLCYGVPIYDSLEDIPRSFNSVPGFVILVISAATILLVSYIVIGCVCCPNKSIKALTYQNGFPVSRLNENNPLQFENPTEFAIFPPHSAVIDLQPVSQGYPTFDDKVTFEPLPDILPRKLSGQSAACSSRPAHFRVLLKTKVSLHDWFDDPNSNFPRDQLQYISELGCGWFGRVVEGEAGHICNDQEKTAVIVKILREEASPSEHLHFLHEVRPYRDLSHPNVVRLLGRCLESDPFLLIVEHSISDLKSYLLQQENKDTLLKNGITLQMACNVAAGLRCLHENGFTHMDLAAHNCFVCSDNSVKVGDYGTSFDRCREDYYCLVEIALPIRWCSPETLLCTEATIETKEITKEANIWAFGVVLWEIFEFGKLPYEELTNEQVLQKVLIDQSVLLPPPTMDFPIKEEMSLIMKECWKVANSRPPMEKVEKFLTRLYNDRHNLKTLETSFEERWNALQSKVTEVRSIASDRISLKFENDFSERSDTHNYSSDGERFSSFEASYDIFSKNINGQLSPSLRVLNGSIDELTENDISVSMGFERSASATSDRTLSNLEDDQGSQIGEIVTPAQIAAAIRDLDLGGGNLSLDTSRQLQKHQLNSYNNNVNAASFVEHRNENLSYNNNLPLAGDTDENQNSPGSLSFVKSQNIVSEPYPDNDFKAVDDNYNELPITTENHNRDSAIQENKEIVQDISSSDLQPSIEGQGTKADSNIFSEERTQHILKQDRPCILSSVPDIVVHESPSVFESSHDENENIVPDVADNTPTNESPKAFRFVFKEESTLNSQDNQTANNSEDTSGSQNTPDNENMSSGRPLIKGRSHPLTSTPLKSTNEINIESNESFCNPDDSGNVFYASSISEIGSGKSEDKTPPKPGCQVIDETELHEQSDVVAPIDKIVPDSIASNGTLYYEAQGSRTDTTFRIQNSNAVVNDNYTSCDQENFVSAQSTFLVYNSDAISKTILIDDSVNDSPFQVPPPNVNKIENVGAVVVNIPTVSVEEENDCALPSTEAESLDKDYKWPSVQETKSDSNTDAFHEDPHKLVANEDLLSLDYGEPVTPDVSFNVSSCSYENEGRTFSTSSPGISSENVKDSEESDCETSGSKRIGVGNQHHLGMNYVAAEASAGPNNLTLSEASSAEFLDSYSPEPASDSFAHRNENRMESAGNLRGQKSSFNSEFLNFASTNHKTDLFYEEDDLEDDSDGETRRKRELRLHLYDEVIVEDLETGEQTIITESFSTCDDYENSAESDEILKINTETDEAIIVDSSEALVGFVPSRSIEMLQDCEILPNLNPMFHLEEERESSDSNHFDASNSASSSPAHVASNLSPYDSPDATYHPPCSRNFSSLQNEVIEEEITDEISSASPSMRSSASFSSCELYGEERMSQSSSQGSRHAGAADTTSVLPTAELFYGDSGDDSAECSPGRSVQSDDYNESDDDPSECSPVRRIVNNMRCAKDSENNCMPADDVMHSWQPTQSVRWHSDDTLDIERDSPVILEGREILAGGMLETRGMSVKDITTAIHQLEVADRRDRLNVSRTPSPYGSSVESSPCRDDAYTPDFESDSSEEDASSCSSTSGSFECVHNRFKSSDDISREPPAEDSEPEEVEDGSSRRQSPLKIFSKTWDCHATPTKGVLMTPEKKFNSMRKSVSFHEEDPQVVFEYPPCSDSEDGPMSEEINPWKVDYRNYADWELQVGENEEIEEILEIEELDSEPYVRRPTYGIGSSLGPMNRPMLYSLTSGFSDDDMDFSDPIPTDSVAPSNSPEEGKQSPLSEDEIGNLIRSQLNNLALEESRLKWMQDVLDQQSSKFPSDKPDQLTEEGRASSFQDPISEQEIEEILPEGNEMVAISEDHCKDVDNSFLIGKPVEDSFSKLRLSTLATLEEIRSANCSEASVPKDSDANISECFNSVDIVPDVVSFHDKTRVSEMNSSQSSRMIDSGHEESAKLIDIISATKTGSFDYSESSAPVLKDSITDTITGSFNSVASSGNVFAEENQYHSDIKNQSKDNCLDENISPQVQNVDAGHIFNEDGTKHVLKMSIDNSILKYAIKDDLIQSISPEFDSKDSVNSSGAFLLSSGASSILDCPDINGISEKKYFDLNDTSIVHTESDASDDFMSSLEIKKENEGRESSKIGLGKCHAASSQEEIIPTLDFLNADLPEIAPIFPLSKESMNNEINHFDILPLTLEEGNKRPNSSKFQVLCCEGDDAVKTEQGLISCENASMEPLLCMDSHWRNSLSSALSENVNLIKPIQNTNTDLISTADTHVSEESHLDNKDLKKNENFKQKADELSSEDNSFISNSKINDEVTKVFNKDYQTIFSADACDLSTGKLSGTIENIIEGSVSSIKEYILNPSETSSDSLMSKENLPKETISTHNLDENCFETREHDFSFEFESNIVEETISATGCLLIENENSSVSENIQLAKEDSAPVSIKELTKDITTDSEINNVQNNDCVSISTNESNDLNIVPLSTADETTGKSNHPIVTGLDFICNITTHDKSKLDYQTVPMNNTPKENVSNLKENSSDFSNFTNDLCQSDTLAKYPSSDIVKESALDTLTETLPNAATKSKASEEAKDAVPKIVVTPASESEIEDELEEYLRNQLKFGYGPEATSEDDFSVTSQYTVQPFEDVFGTYNAPGTSRDYIEAYNFEFNGGDFFEDFSDDLGIEERVNEAKRWESPTERANADSVEKRDSSPLCCVSKDSTHL